MRPFTFIQAQAAKTAIGAALGNESRFIAGGTNLLDLMKFGVEQPQQLIDINGLPFQEITMSPDGSILIGAMVRNSDMAYHETLRTRYPVLSEALLSGASPQLRNMATVGGNLMQRTRCPYFYDTVFPCNKRLPQSGCSAMLGYNRGNAILGTSDSCIATHPSDLCVALAALDAIVHVTGAAMDREIPIRDFHLLPGQTPEIETALRPGELITGVVIPDLPFGRRSHYLKVRDRASYEFALASAAVALDVRDGNIQAARVALGGVGAKPWRSPEAEAVLVGAPASETIFRDAADAALRDAKPHQYNAFKVDLAKRILVRALNTVGEMHV
jgi:xanthine dehydrogenase YagS FAD-binding subunit